MAKSHVHVSLHLCLTWVCCCKRDAVLSVERGFILREETKVDDEQTLTGECVQHSDSHHEVVWIVVWSCVTGSYSVTDSAPIARSQLHQFQKHLSDVPEVGDKEKLVAHSKHGK